MIKKTRLAIIVSHPIQHFVHFYRALAKVPGLELKVFYATNIGVRPYFDQDMGVEIAWNTNLLEGYDYVFLPEAEFIKKTGFSTVNNPSVTKALDEFVPDVIKIHGYGQITLLRAFFWGLLRRIPVLLWSDSSLVYRRSNFKEFIKKFVLGIFFSRISAVLSPGDNNERYYRHYGVPSNKIYRCAFTVDEDMFSDALAKRLVIRRHLRNKYGLSCDAFVFLFVGKLIPLKRPKDILVALSLLKERHFHGVDIQVVFAGDGVLRKELEQYVLDWRLPVSFAGFVNVDLLPSVYAMADALIFSSDREAYGLSAREAICVGLPLIVSDQIGCVGRTDAAREGENAIVYRSGDTDSLASAITRLTTDSETYRQMSEASLRVASELNIDASIRGITRAIDAVISRTL